MIRVLQSKDVDTSGKTWYRFSGDSTDSKPTGEYPAGSGRTVAVGSRFFENGTEIVYELKADGWTAVGQESIPVPEPTLIEKTITENGEYDPADDDADGYSSVSVDVEPNLTTKSIIANGTYTASADNADGYSSVSVNVPAPTLTGFDDVTITEMNPYALVYYQNRNPTTIKCTKQGNQEVPPGCTVVGWIDGTF